jgi:5S rRNA maturation endonuclease (ribonuclease M5)
VFKTTASDLEETLNHTSNMLEQVEKDKAQVLKDLDTKTNELNQLLANYIKEKNTMAEKLNYMNDL